MSKNTNTNSSNWTAGAAKSRYSPKKPVRRASLISPWGVGSMVDFPGDESLMTAGLDAWPRATDECPADWKIIEERLQQRLGVDYFRLPPDYRDSGMGALLPCQTVPFVRFPQWHSCPWCGHLRKLKLFSTQIPRCDAPHWEDGRSCDKFQEGRTPRLLPVRFVAICSVAGHIQDFPFVEWVHRKFPAQESCQHNLRLRDGRTSAGLSGIKIQCRCGATETMNGAFGEKSLDKIAGCCGQRPWLGEDRDAYKEDERPQDCGETLRVVQRGASNTYFPHVASSIYLPLWGEDVRRPVVEMLEDPNIWEILTSVTVDGKIDLVRCQICCQLQNWRGIKPEELQDAAQKRVDGATDSSVAPVAPASLDQFAEEEQFRFDEYRAMQAGKTVESGLEMDKHSANDYTVPVKGFFRTITLVRKLRETRALYGFSRSLPEDGRPIDEQIAQMRLNSTLNWLPAIVTRGEGIFFEVSDEALTQWLGRQNSQKSPNDLITAMNRARASREQTGRQLSAKFVMLHTLAHLIINQLAFDCGYGSSSLRERIYCDGSFQEPDRAMNGFLIYTASGDAEGTMGGLVRQGEAGRLEKTLARALSRARWCSYDPVCAESSGQGPDNCNRAACHGCAILPETSCEEGNRLLDRVTVIGLPDDLDSGFFSSFLQTQSTSS